MEQIKENEDLFARAAKTLGIAGLFGIVIPWLMPSLGVAAIVCGFCGRNSKAYHNRAMLGIAFGAAVLLIGMTMMLAMGALAPYLDELAAALMK